MTRTRRRSRSRSRGRSEQVAVSSGGVPSFGAALREHDHQPAEQQQCPRETAVGPEVRLREQRDERDRDQADAGQEPGPVAVAPEGLGHDRVALALVRDHEPGGDVEQDARAADERQDREADPEERRGDVEVPPKAPGDAGEDPARPDCGAAP